MISDMARSVAAAAVSTAAFLGVPRFPRRDADVATARFETLGRFSGDDLCATAFFAVGQPDCAIVATVLPSQSVATRAIETNCLAFTGAVTLPRPMWAEDVIGVRTCDLSAREHTREPR
jgi:hypothetical protein